MTYQIPDSLASQYHGAGWALAALSDGQVVALRYVDDLAPELADDDGQLDPKDVAGWMLTDAARPTIRELQALGSVAVGMCSGWTFTER